MIGPFSQRSIGAIGAAAALLALLLLLSRTNIPTGTATPTDLYIVDPSATGIEVGATFTSLQGSLLLVEVSLQMRRRHSQPHAS